MRPTPIPRLSARCGPPCCNHPKSCLNLLNLAGTLLAKAAGGTSSNGGRQLIMAATPWQSQEFKE